MRKTITVVERTDTRKEIEVEFPIYRVQTFEGSATYTRIDADLSALHITVNSDDSVEIEREAPYNFLDGSNVAYHTGAVPYASTRDGFLWAVGKVVALTTMIADVMEAPTDAR